ncbi:MAG: hypothetical protein HUU01_21785 [Saprospiraceae bacterium]|nr:hypothetical protein [Saprospiraceae bacterium]
MNKNLLILVVLFSWAFGRIAFAQQVGKKENAEVQRKSSTTKIRYWVWPVPIDSSKGLKMSLYETQDSSLVFAHSGKRFQHGITETETVPVSGIKDIYFRRRTAPSTGAIIGGFTGLIVGALIASEFKSSSYSSGSGSGSGFGFSPIGGLDGIGESFLGMAIGITAGAITGKLIGSSRIKISLNGDWKSYSKQREQLKKISITKQ